jgi:hypothetical protein
MNFDTIVHNGRIVLEVGDAMPEGTPVKVTVNPSEARAAEPSEEPTLKSFLRLSGALKGMPSDFAEQHHHYIHGTPKR